MAAQAFASPNGEDGRMTVRVAATPDQTWALDAEYLHEINRTIHRMEERIEPVADTTELALRRERMQLKDQLYAMMQPSGFTRAN